MCGRMHNEKTISWSGTAKRNKNRNEWNSNPKRKKYIICRNFEEILILIRTSGGSVWPANAKIQQQQQQQIKHSIIILSRWRTLQKCRAVFRYQNAAHSEWEGRSERWGCGWVRWDGMVQGFSNWIVECITANEPGVECTMCTIVIGVTIIWQIASIETGPCKSSQCSSTEYRRTQRERTKSKKTHANEIVALSSIVNNHSPIR